MLSTATRQLIKLAIEEDLGAGDVTTDALISDSVTANARIVAKEELVVCGQEVAREVFVAIGRSVVYEILVADGQRAAPKMEIARIHGSLASILKGERTALNFLQRLSGVATLTSAVVARMQGSGVKILDTRKTTPGWRELEKLAVRTGGGTNHRMGLYDAVLIKNNHLSALSGDIVQAVQLCRSKAGAGVFVQVEARTRSEVEQVVAAKPDGVLLDNMSPAEVSEMIALLRAQLGDSFFIEASGGISLTDVADYRLAGLSAVSMGQLTHSARAVDLSLYFNSF